MKNKKEQEFKDYGPSLKTKLITEVEAQMEEIIKRLSELEKRIKELERDLRPLVPQYKLPPPADNVVDIMKKQKFDKE